MSMVLSERRGAIACLTLNNPAQHNALGGSLLADLDAALDEAVRAPAARAVLITGAGKGFCSGAQFGGDTFSSGASIAERMRGSINPVIEKLRNLPLPVVAAVNGPAAGAGVGIALATDIVVAAKSARFILSFARLGAVLDGGTSLFLQRSIGTARARALSLLGEPLAAETAQEWGLIWRTVDDAVLLDEAFGIAQRLADGPPIALGMIKRQLETAWNAPLAEVLETEAAEQGKAFATADLREGATAFMEKRPPRFAGS